MKLYEAGEMLKAELMKLYEEGEAGAVADLALEALTSLPRHERAMNKNERLTVEQELRLEELKKRLLTQEPIQYVLNEAWFYGLKFFVNRDVLIPRPETEELVDWIVKDIQKFYPDAFHKSNADADQTRRLKILDVGTGSGCIAIALKKTIPLAEVWGCDLSDKALNVARRNGSELDVRVDFQQLDFLDDAQQKQLPTVHVLVSNPPYVPLKDREEMKPNVLEFEPHTALFVENNDPLLFYKAIARFGHHRLHPNGTIYLEIHEQFGREVEKLFQQEGYEIERRKDMQGKDRMVRGKRMADGY